MNKPVITVEQGKVNVVFNLVQEVDGDKDGKAAAKLTSSNHLEIDSYELATELIKKDSAVLEMVLKNLNYKKAE